MGETEAAAKPVRDGLVTAGDGGAGIRLLGSRCGQCGEVAIGTNAVCLNCGSEQIEHVTLANEGVLWTYTVVRHKPPGRYLGPDPFEPFAIGLVELPDGVRVMAPLDGAIDAFEIGMPLGLVPWVLHAPDGESLLAFRFAASGATS